MQSFSFKMGVFSVGKGIFSIKVAIRSGAASTTAHVFPFLTKNEYFLQFFLKN